MINNMSIELFNINNFKLFDYFILSIILISMFFGFYKGFIQSILGLLTWVGAVIITVVTQEKLSIFLIYYLDQIPLVNKTLLPNIISTILSIIFIFIISLMILKKIRSIISSEFQKSSIGYYFDKIIGLIYGLVFGVLIISITIIIIDKVFSNNFTKLDFIKESELYSDTGNLLSIERFINVILSNQNRMIEETEDILEENIE